MNKTVAWESLTGNPITLGGYSLSLKPSLLEFQVTPIGTHLNNITLDKTTYGHYLHVP